MSDDGVADNGGALDGGVLTDELLSRLRVIEDQPLSARATAYVQLHDELRGRLEGGDVTNPRG